MKGLYNSGQEKKTSAKYERNSQMFMKTMAASPPGWQAHQGVHHAAAWQTEREGEGGSRERERERERESNTITPPPNPLPPPAPNSTFTTWEGGRERPPPTLWPPLHSWQLLPAYLRKPLWPQNRWGRNQSHRLTRPTQTSPSDGCCWSPWQQVARSRSTVQSVWWRCHWAAVVVSHWTVHCTAGDSYHSSLIQYWEKAIWWTWKWEKSQNKKSMLEKQKKEACEMFQRDRSDYCHVIMKDTDFIIFSHKTSWLSEKSTICKLDISFIVHLPACTLWLKWAWAGRANLCSHITYLHDVMQQSSFWRRRLGGYNEMCDIMIPSL